MHSRFDVTSKPTASTDEKNNIQNTGFKRLIWELQFPNTYIFANLFISQASCCNAKLNLTDASYTINKKIQQPQNSQQTQI
jgi:hypothetical protein